MKFSFFSFYKTPLHIAIEKENIDIIKLLLSNEKLNVNLKSVSYCIIII